MSTSKGGGDGDGVVPAESRKLLRRLTEILVGRPEEEIYAVLIECDMDPNEAILRLLSQDPFQEVKSKREKKKEGGNKMSRGGATNSSNQSRKYDPSLHGRSAYKKEKGPPGLINDDPAAGTGSKRSLLGRPNGTSLVAQRVSGHPPDRVGVHGQVSMADNVRSGKTNKKGLNAPNASHHSVDCPTDDAAKVHQSQVSSIPTKDECSSIEKTPAAAAHVVCGIEKITEEQTMNILSRLTAIELVRCKTVCKSWKSLISSSEFVSQHLKRSISDPSSHYLLVSNSLVLDLDRNIPGPFNSVACFSSGDMVIIGSVNGLICMAGKTLCSPKSADDIWILNPATGLSRNLPLPFKSRLTDNTETVLFAFWFDEITDGGVYKVAKLVSMFDDGPAMLEVWVSNSPATWTEVSTFDFNFYPGFRMLRDCDVLIEGFAAYWIVSDYDEDIFVLSLDLKTLALKLIPLYDEQKYMPVIRRSWVIGGIQNNILFGAKVHGKFVLIKNGFSNDGTFYVWTMLMDGSEFEGWNLSYRLLLEFPFDRCLGGCINGKLVLESERNVLTLLDMDTGAEDFLGVDYELARIFMDSAHDIVGSLVSIKGFKRNDLNKLYIGFSWPRDYPYGWGRTCKKKM